MSKAPAFFAVLALVLAAATAGMRFEGFSLEDLGFSKIRQLAGNATANDSQLTNNSIEKNLPADSAGEEEEEKKKSSFFEAGVEVERPG